MYIRKTTENDILNAALIYDSARAFMKENGNSSQWKDGHPNADDIKNDISRGESYVCVDKDEIVGIFFFKVGDDKTYNKIYNGNWNSEKPYAVIHRVAVKYHGKGIIKFIFDECYKLHSPLRIDTHRDNLPMKRALLKNGFKYCGIIHLENGDERLAFEKE